VCIGSARIDETSFADRAFAGRPFVHTHPQERETATACFPDGAPANDPAARTFATHLERKDVQEELEAAIGSGENGKLGVAEMMNGIGTTSKTRSALGGIFPCPLAPYP